MGNGCPPVVWHAAGARGWGAWGRTPAGHRAGRHSILSSVRSSARPVTVPTGGFQHRLLTDRKSTRLNSSHLGISYAVFCLKTYKAILLNDTATTEIYTLSLHDALPIYYLPFEALLDRSRYLLEDFSIAYSPSATAYSLMRRARRERPRTAERELLAFGDSQFRAGGRRFNVEGPALVRSIYRSTGFTFPPLPNSRTEVVAIAKLFPESLERTYLGVSATKSRLFSEKLDSSRCLHFATHAMLDERTPAQCGIALTPDGSKGDDGILRMNEIVDMKLNADLVVLSACQTGLGRLVRGQGMIGLTRAFLYAGAGSVVVSLWRVDDLASSRLMQKFYKRMREGLDIPAALRQAKLDMLGSGIPAYRNPYFWAPFVVTGAF